MQSTVTPDSKNKDVDSTGFPSLPPINLKGEDKDGYEWIEWPENSGRNWYRVTETDSEWKKWTD